MARIIGISAFYHDSAVALVDDGNVKFAAQEERYTRIKNDPSFPANALKELLKHAHPSTIDAIIFHEKPFLKFERILESYLHYAPVGFTSFNYSMSDWIKNKLFFKNYLRTRIATAFGDKTKQPELLFSEHHLSHASFSYFTSGFDQAALVSIDGVGEWSTTSIKKGLNNQILPLYDQYYPNSIGLLYSSFTYFLGFSINSGEYKVMGLAPYGNSTSIPYNKYYQVIKDDMVRVFEDGSIQLNQKFFCYSTSLKMIKTKRWETLFGIPIRSENAELTQDHCDLALAIQRIIEEIIVKLVTFAKSITNSGNLCLSGGVALNCVSNGRLQESGLFKNIHVPCSPGDSGSAIGAALLANYTYFDSHRRLSDEHSFSPYLGDVFEDAKIEAILNEASYPYKLLTDLVLMDIIARELSSGKIIGWFQGRTEFGPRSLGNRCILADTRSEFMQERINVMVKGRESFRPFAPVILESEASKYYPSVVTSPFMQFALQLDVKYQNEKSEKFDSLSIKQKQEFKISEFPATTHVDFTSRIQTVSSNQNIKLWSLLTNYYKLTGCPMLLNTSFNLNNEPIVNSPSDALNCFRNSALDILVINNYLVRK